MIYHNEKMYSLVAESQRATRTATNLLWHYGDQVSAHRPLELTRMAVHDACGREMAAALREYRMWTARNRNRIGGGGGGGRCNSATQTALAQKASTVLMAVAASQGCGGGGSGKRAHEAASKERVAELKRTPAGWRTLRWAMMKRHAELKSQAAEATAMYTEEMEQRHKERCGVGSWRV